MMGDELGLNMLQILHGLARRVPKIIVQRVEEIFPSLNEGTVSILWLYVKRLP
jgi:hypothetical protein